MLLPSHSAAYRAATAAAASSASASASASTSVVSRRPAPTLPQRRSRSSSSGANPQPLPANGPSTDAGSIGRTGLGDGSSASPAVGRPLLRRSVSISASSVPGTRRSLWTTAHANGSSRCTSCKEDPFSTRCTSGRSIDRSNSAQRNRAFSSSSRAQASSKDLYSVLGLKRDASAKDIKGAYYQLAKKYHPDTNKEAGSKERFVEIQNAYDILSDEKKKAAYDQYGSTDGSSPGFNPFGGAGGNPFAGASGGFGGFSAGPGASGFGGFSAGDASNIFDSLFGAFGGGGPGGARGRQSGFGGAGFAGGGVERGDDIETTVSISFEDAARGTTRKITTTPIERCGTCDGAGLKKGARRSTCGVCNGTGTRTFVIQSGFQMASTCPACSGTGQVVNPGDSCNTCDGVGRVRGRRVEEVRIPAGVDDGTKIRIDGRGDVPLAGAGVPGSLYVRISVQPSKIWRRQGSNLHYNASVPFHTAVLGGRVRVPTLDGDVDVRVPSGTQVGEEMLLRGRGVPLLGRRSQGGSTEKGDLLVRFEVKIPRSLTPKQREILEQYAADVEGRTAAAAAAAAAASTPTQTSGRATAAQSNTPKSSTSSSATSSRDTAAGSSAAGSSSTGGSTPKARSTGDDGNSTTPKKVADTDAKDGRAESKSGSGDANSSHAEESSAQANAKGNLSGNAGPSKSGPTGSSSSSSSSKGSSSKARPPFGGVGSGAESKDTTPSTDGPHA